MNGSKQDGLYGALEEALKAADEPLDCNDLFELASIRKHAATVNRVSDYLGNMWRKGDVVRMAAPRTDTTRSRWMYAWKGRVKAKPKLDEISEAAAFTSERVGVLLSRPNMEISEEGKTVVITLPNFTIAIKQR